MASDDFQQVVLGLALEVGRMSCQDLKAKLVQCNVSVRALEGWKTSELEKLDDLVNILTSQAVAVTHLAQGIEAIGPSCLDGILYETGGVLKPAGFTMMFLCVCWNSKTMGVLET